MGTYNSTYIGIYLEVPYSKATRIVKTYVDPQGKKTKNKFDPNTGQKNGVKEEMVVDEITPSSYIVDVPGLGEDEFFTPAYTNGGKKIQTFLLNGRSKYSYTEDDLFNFDLGNVNPSQLIEDFRVEYAPYLEYYQQKYGDFTIKYGVVNYAH